MVALILLGLLMAAGANAYVRETSKENIFDTGGELVSEGAMVESMVTLTTEQGMERSLPTVDAVVVLGCGVRSDGTPSPMLSARLEQGIQLYKAGLAKKLLMSGDHAYQGYDEVNTMKQYAMDAGVPAEDIFMDHAGLSTYDSVWRAKNIFQCEKIVLVSQTYHLYRAVYLARRVGMEAYGVSADFQVYAGQQYYDFREFFARGSAFVQGIFLPDATFGGEEIPISGDGNVTND